MILTSPFPPPRAAGTSIFFRFEKIIKSKITAHVCFLGFLCQGLLTHRFLETPADRFPASAAGFASSAMAS
jgi:hypothetical protein